MYISQVRNKKKHIALFFLIVFISLKTFSLHTLSHNDDTHYNDCEICEYIIESNKISFIENDSIESKEFVEHCHKKQVFLEYNYQFSQQQIEKSLFYRPPPTV